MDDRKAVRSCWCCHASALFVTFLITCGQADHVTSSTDKLTSLVRREQMLLDHLSQIASLASRLPALQVKHKQITELNKTIEFLRRRHAPLERHPDVLQHPVAAFRLIRRLASDWDRITDPARITGDGTQMGFVEKNLLNMRDILAKWRTWPQESSSEDAALGLIRIGHAYSLYPAPSTSLNSTQIPNLRLFAKSDRQCNLTEVSTNRPPLSFGYFSNHRCHAHDKHAPLAESVENNSDNLDLFRFLHNKDFHHSIAWLPLPIENNSSDNSSEQTRARVDPTSESQTRSYSYNFLSSRDLRFIAQVARDNQYCEESKTWAALAQFTASTSESQTDTGDFASIDPSTASERDQKHSSLYEMFSDECPEPKDSNEHVDSINKRYTLLCQHSAQESALPTWRSERCKWRHVWPYVRYREEVIKSDPEISRFYDVLSPGDIRHIQDLAQSQLLNSELSSMVKDNVRNLRVSQTAWLPDKTPTLQKLSKLVGEITGLDSGFSEVDTPSELFQVVNYGLGGLYAPHEDSVRTSRDMGTETSGHLRNAGDRVATWMFYLSDVKLGGDTVFPALNVSLAPIQGSAVLWYNLLRNGEPDTRLVHAGCPVAIGDKWIANKWIRERSQTFRRPCLLKSHL